MLTQTTTIDQITITANGSVLFRELRVVLDDGVQIASSYHRHSLPPGTPLEGVPEAVEPYCTLAWTPEVIAAHEARLAAAQADIEG